MSAATQTLEPTGDPEAIALIMGDTLGKAPETLPAIIAHNSQVWRNSLVPPSILEVMRLRNARTVQCVTCKAVRYDVARADGFEERKAQMVSASYRESELSPREKAAVTLADCYLGFPAGAGAAVAGEVSREFSHAEICSMLLALMSFNFTSRAAVSHGGMPKYDLPITELKI